MNNNHVHDESCRDTALDERIGEFRKFLLSSPLTDSGDLWGVIEVDDVLVMQGEPPRGLNDIVEALNLLFRAYRAHKNGDTGIGAGVTFILGAVALGMTPPENRPCGCLVQSDMNGELVLYCIGHMINRGLGGIVRE